MGEALRPAAQVASRPEVDGKRGIAAGGCWSPKQAKAAGICYNDPLSDDILKGFIMDDDRTRYTVSIKRPDLFYVSANDIDDLKMIAIETQIGGKRGTLPALTFAYWGMIALQMPEFRRFCDSYHDLGFDFLKEPERLLDYLTKNPPDSWVKAVAH